MINISQGRQLFVDDALVSSYSGTLVRKYHQPQYHGASPMLGPDRPWEETHINGGFAIPFSDGVRWNPANARFECHYMAGLFGERHTCFAYSYDGILWIKPSIDVEGTNKVLSEGIWRDSQSVVRDPADADWPWKLVTFRPGGIATEGTVRFSRNGIWWDRVAGNCPPCGDRSTVFYDPFRQKWVYSIRAGGEVGGPPRHRLYNASNTIVPETWNPVYWVGADGLDLPGTTAPQLYNLDVAAYESLLVGLFCIYHGDRNDAPKLVDVHVGWSRDGFTWVRSPNRATPFLPMGDAGSWNYGNVQSVGGCYVTSGDYMGFYASGRAGVPGSPAHGRSSMGMAYFRRDGFASVEGTGTLTTSIIQFTGRHLFVNANATNFRVEILSPDLSVSYITSHLWSGNYTKGHVGFPIADLGAGIGQPLRLRFHLHGGQLYSFWVANDPTGRSGGYINGPEQNWEGRDA